jgi:UrcA family protein
MIKLVLAAAAALTVGAAGQAFAAAEVAPTKTVAVSDVDFRDQATTRRAYVRLHRAAATACDSNSANPRIAQADRLCAKKAMAKAVAEVNRPVLTAMFEQSRGAPVSGFAANDQ